MTTRLACPKFAVLTGSLCPIALTRPGRPSLTPVTLYAAYGTNLDPARMSERCPHSPLRETGWLEGWRLTFGGEELGWDGALAPIVPDPFEQVFVAIYAVTDEDVSALDDW